MKLSAISQYAQQHHLDEAALIRITAFMHFTRINITPVIDLQAETAANHLMEILFNSSHRLLVYHPLSRTRPELENFCERIGLDLNSSSAVNLMRHYRADMRVIHQLQTLRFFLDNQEEINHSERLEKSEQRSAELLIHAFHLCVNKRAWLSQMGNSAVLTAQLLQPLLLRTEDDAHVIQERFQVEQMLALGQMNAELFRLLSESMVTEKGFNDLTAKGQHPAIL